MNVVIYCRVSSKEQVDGTSLESQQLACKEYADRNHLTVLRVFIERGESAKFADRPQLLEMLAFCAKRENGVEQLLVWKVDRLARNVGDHFNIKAGLMKQGISVVSVTEPIDTKPEGKLLETILAGFAQFDNDIRAARCTQGMRRKIQEGIFPWKPPLGYKSANRPGAKKALPDVPDQPAFGIIQKGFEEFATGHLTKAGLQRLLIERGLRARRGRLLAPQTVDYMLSDEFYAGVVRDPWSGERFPGKHLPMISQKAFNAIQRIVAGRNRSVPHISVRTEFPLRTFVRCANCEATLTGAFSRGRSARYPYYHCFRRNCDNRRSYPLGDVHREFEAFLMETSANSHAFDHLREAVRRIGETATASQHLTQERRRDELKRIKEQFGQLLQLKMEGLLTVEEFRTQRAILSSRIAELEGEISGPLPEIDSVVSELEALRTQLSDLASLWKSLSIENRKRFQLLTLPRGYIFGRVRTAQRGRIFSLIGASEHSNTSLVHPEGDSWNQLANEIQTLSLIATASRVQ
jgi:DNA invertase Pin-like site-specific DNA recombinase